MRYLFLFVFGCQTVIPDKPQELQRYISRFEYHANLNGLSVDDRLDELQIVYRSLPGNRIAETSSRLMSIDTTKDFTEDIFIHELGHAILLRDHLDDRFPLDHPKKGIPVSIMGTYTYPFVSGEDSLYYWNELFSIINW